MKLAPGNMLALTKQVTPSRQNKSSKRLIRRLELHKITLAYLNFALSRYRGKQSDQSSLC